MSGLSEKNLIQDFHPGPGSRIQGSEKLRIRCALSHSINVGYRILFPTITDLCLGAGNASAEEGQVHLQAPDTGGEQHAASLTSTPGLQFFRQFAENS